MVSRPPLTDVAADRPLRLSVAAALAFPDGSMTASGLRRECARGRLVIEHIAGKDYTTLADIERMRELCRKPQKDRACGSVAEPGGAPSDLSATTADTRKALDAALTIVEGLSRSSPSTSPASGSTGRRGARVIPLPSRSPT